MCRPLHSEARTSMNVDRTATRRHLAENLAAGIQCNINNERSALRMLLRLFFIPATPK
jgi:hypothetical protein